MIQVLEVPSVGVVRWFRYQVHAPVAERSIAPDCKSGALTATEVRILPGAQTKIGMSRFFCAGGARRLLASRSDSNAGACPDQHVGTRGGGQPEERDGATRGEAESSPAHRVGKVAACTE